MIYKIECVFIFLIIVAIILKMSAINDNVTAFAVALTEGTYSRLKSVAEFAIKSVAIERNRLEAFEIKLITERAEFEAMRAEFKVMRAVFEVKNAEFEVKKAGFEVKKAEFDLNIKPFMDINDLNKKLELCASEIASRLDEIDDADKRNKINKAEIDHERQMMNCAKAKFDIDVHAFHAKAQAVADGKVEFPIMKQKTQLEKTVPIDIADERNKVINKFEFVYMLYKDDAYQAHIECEKILRAKIDKLYEQFDQLGN